VTAQEDFTSFYLLTAGRRRRESSCEEIRPCCPTRDVPPCCRPKDVPARYPSRDMPAPSCPPRDPCADLRLNGTESRSPSGERREHRSVSRGQSHKRADDYCPDGQDDGSLERTTSTKTRRGGPCCPNPSERDCESESRCLVLLIVSADAFCFEPLSSSNRNNNITRTRVIWQKAESL